MTVTLEQVLKAEPAVGRLAQLRLPIKTAYVVAKLHKAVQAERAEFDAQRNALIRELGTADDKAQTIQIPQGTPEWAVFAAKIQDLLGVEVNLVWTPMSAAGLGDVSISAEDAIALEPFIAEAPTQE